MATGSSGAVFFLGTRAHYQVLQPPDTVSYDLENGNGSPETIYRNPSPVQELWSSQVDGRDPQDGGSQAGECGSWMRRGGSEYASRIALLETDGGVGCGGTRLRRIRRQGSGEPNGNVEDVDPTALNMCDSGSPKTRGRCARGRGRCASLRALLAALRPRRADRPRRPRRDSLDMCTYKDSCRCLDCQCRYFECDESDDDSSEGELGEFGEYSPPLAVTLDEPVQSTSQCDFEELPSDNEEVFIDMPPSDNTSTDLLLEGDTKKMSVSSEEMTESDLEEKMQLEMAAGTPVVLDYILNHPITCAIQ